MFYIRSQPTEYIQIKNDTWHSYFNLSIHHIPYFVNFYSKIHKFLMYDSKVCVKTAFKNSVWTSLRSQTRDRYLHENDVCIIVFIWYRKFIFYRSYDLQDQVTVKPSTLTFKKYMQSNIIVFLNYLFFSLG